MRGSGIFVSGAGEQGGRLIVEPAGNRTGVRSAVEIPTGTAGSDLGRGVHRAWRLRKGRSATMGL